MEGLGLLGPRAPRDFSFSDSSPPAPQPPGSPQRPEAPPPSPSPAALLPPGGEQNVPSHTGGSTLVPKGQGHNVLAVGTECRAQACHPHAALQVPENSGKNEAKGPYSHEGAGVAAGQGEGSRQPEHPDLGEQGLAAGAPLPARGRAVGSPAEGVGHPHLGPGSSRARSRQEPTWPPPERAWGRTQPLPPRALSSTGSQDPVYLPCEHPVLGHLLPPPGSP